MIQFFGLHLGARKAAVTVLARDLSVSAEVDAQVQNVAADDASGVLSPPVGEWVRAGAFALQEAYFKLPVAQRKVWGFALAGPQGWIALDVEYEPISPLRLVDDAALPADLASWLEANPRIARKIGMVLSPKDYFRFVVSGGLAADVTTASRLDLLDPQASQWSPERVEEKGFLLRWMPPVFDCDVATGRLSEEGIRRTSLPGGFWLVAGAHETEAACLAAGDIRDGRLWSIARAGAPDLLVVSTPHGAASPPPPGWRVVRSPIARQDLLERESSAAASAAAPGGAVDASGSDELSAAAEELTRAGVALRGTVRAAGSPSAGAAALAAISSKLVRGWERYYRDRVVA